MRSIKSIICWSQKQAKAVGAIGAGVIIGGAGSAVVMASIPDATGTFHGCRRISTGVLSVIDNSTQTCAGNEAPMQWNQTGPQGIPGVAGPEGQQGPAGPAGPAGSSGPGTMLSNLVGADFTGASLEYRNFAGVDLHGSILTKASLRGSDLHNANLSDSVIATGNGFVTDLSKADFSGANLSGAQFKTNTISGSAIKIGGSNFQGANFTSATLKGNYAGSGSDFRNAVFFCYYF